MQSFNPRERKVKTRPDVEKGEENMDKQTKFFRVPVTLFLVVHGEDAEDAREEAKILTMENGWDGSGPFPRGGGIGMR